MKKYVALVLALLCILGLVGCTNRLGGTISSDYKNFTLENVSKLIVISVDGKRFEVTDTDTIRQITENIESIKFEKGESSENSNGFGPFIQWYDANDNLIESISVMTEETIIYDGFFWTAIDGNIDYAALNTILENGSQTDTEENGNTIDTEDELSWANGTQIDGTLFQNLNLDGIGDSDDEAYVSIYQFGDYDEKVTVISIHLGTGETMAQVFPVYGDYSLQTGRLFSEEQEDIVLQVCDLTSNYGAATVFVVSISPAGVDPIPSIGTPLNTTESIMLADGNVIDTSLFPNLVTDGTKVVDIEGMPRQGVLIYSVGEEGGYQGLPRIFYWTDNGWTILSEEMPDIFVASLWDRENTARLSPEDAAVIADFVEGGNWMEGTSDCMDDCIIFMDGEEIHYHSDCGTFNDTVNEKRLHLTEKQQAEFNAILEKYIVLNAEFNAIMEE